MTTLAERSEAPDRANEVERILADWRKRGIQNVRFELPDMHGTSRSDVVAGTLYNEEVAYGDQLLLPDPATAAIVPWAEATGRLICDPYWADGRPLAAAPRHVFRRVLDRCHEIGYEPLLGVEPEF